LVVPLQMAAMETRVAPLPQVLAPRVQTLITINLTCTLLMSPKVGQIHSPPQITMVLQLSHRGSARTSGKASGNTSPLNGGKYSIRSGERLTRVVQNGRARKEASLPVSPTTRRRPAPNRAGCSPTVQFLPSKSPSTPAQGQRTTKAEYAARSLEELIQEMRDRAIPPHSPESISKETNSQVPHDQRRLQAGFSQGSINGETVSRSALTSSAVPSLL
jgi:hypothetical protein